jgi:UDP-glucose 4-epimerase
MPGKLADQAVLITGGAGYIGRHAVLAFLESDYRVVVLDNLSTGQRSAIPGGVPFVYGDVGDKQLVDRVIQKHNVSAVVHFAGSIVVPESVADPLKYYRNNTAASRVLVESCVEQGVGRFIFSSTAAVYGSPEKIPVTEDAPTQPVNPYGSSKLVTEWILRDAALAHDFRFVALRYFNVAGADPAGRAGQTTPNATHLIKVASEVATRSRDQMEIFGDDYDTPDGTCIRDYIHVSDLADAHVSALQHLVSSGQSLILNCGYGHGYSVHEVIEAVKREAGAELEVLVAPRRPGDTPAIVADPTRLGEFLGWRPRYDDLNIIVRTAIEWERKLAADKRHLAKQNEL